MHYRFFHKIILSLLLTSHCLAYQANQALLLSSGLDAHIAQSRESFEAIYYQMVEKGLFPLSYNNNLVIKSDLLPDPQKEGVVILKLIEWLEKQDDYNCTLLLEKINYLYFLQFHSFLCKMVLKNDSESKMLSLCQDLYHYELGAQQNRDGDFFGRGNSPFRPGLSKLFLMISIINASELHYEERKETLAFALEGIKREMIAINQGLGVDKIDTDVIKSFITLLEGYAVSQPIIESHSIPKIIIATIIIAVTGWLIYKYVLPQRNEIGKWLTQQSETLFKGFFNEIGQGLYEGVKEASKNDMDAINTNFDEKLAQVMTQVDQANKTLTQLANDVTKANETIGTESEEWRKEANQTNKTLTQLANDVTSTKEIIDKESVGWRNIADKVNVQLDQANKTLVGLEENVTKANKMLEKESPEWRGTANKFADEVTKANETLAGLNNNVTQANKTLEEESPAWRGSALNIANKVADLNKTIDEESKKWKDSVDNAVNGINSVNETIKNTTLPGYGPIVQTPQTNYIEDDNDNPSTFFGGLMNF